MKEEYDLNQWWDVMKEYCVIGDSIVFGILLGQIIFRISCHARDSDGSLIRSNCFDLGYTIGELKKGSSIRCSVDDW